MNMPISSSIQIVFFWTKMSHAVAERALNGFHSQLCTYWVGDFEKNLLSWTLSFFMC